MAYMLSDIFFGYADGETESKNPDFINLFYKENNKYAEITLNPIKFIVSGQKGTGKTILARYIEKTCTKAGGICKILDRHDITLAKLIEVDNNYIGNDEIIIFYKWFILKEISNQIKQKIKPLTSLKKSSMEDKICYCKYLYHRRALNKILKVRYQDGNFEFKEYEKSLGKKTSDGYNLKADPFLLFKINCEKYRSVNLKYKQKPYYKVIAELEKHVVECLKSQDIILILDDLDELDVKLEDDIVSRDALLNLIFAIREINDLFIDNKIISSKSIMVIRGDILETLNKHSSNLNKILVDREVNLYWNDKKNGNPENHMLMEMILSKARRSCPKLRDMDNKALYKALFPEEIDNKKALNYLLDYSFGRPRDLINYLNIMKESYPTAISFTPSMFRECRLQYSIQFKNELCNELHIHFEIEYVEDLLELLKQFSHRTFSYEEIETFYKLEKRKYKYIKDLKKGIENLYRFGVIGNTFEEVYRGNNTQLKYLWSYRLDGCLNPDFFKKFTVHYALRKSLGM